MKKTAFLFIFYYFINALIGQRYQIAPNQRYITKEGKPFLWLGDTAWELFHRCNLSEAREYLLRRKEQGFSVIQAVVIPEFDGMRIPNASNELPFYNEDLTKPNEAYFKHIDEVIKIGEEYQLTMAILPTWGDKLYKETWGKGPEVLNTNNSYTYGLWLANRLKNNPNIIWVLGGDRNPRNNTQDADVWRSMAKGIGEAYGGHSKILMTFHPQPNKEGASEWFHHEDWFDFNMFQTGHCRDTKVYELINNSFMRKPTKPVINGEPIYEDHPVCFRAKDLGYSSAYDIRKAAYLSLFSGAFGHTYGCHSIWQFYDTNREPVNGPLKTWRESLNLQGANQIQYIKQLLSSVNWHEAIPDQSMIKENNNRAYERIQACSGNNFALVYTTLGDGFSINTNKLAGKQIIMKWFNPRNGKYSEPQLINKSNKWIKFSPPESGYGIDWVLVLTGK
jgi:hypothetical protein